MQRNNLHAVASLPPVPVSCCECVSVARTADRDRQPLGGTWHVCQTMVCAHSYLLHFSAPCRNLYLIQ